MEDGDPVTVYRHFLEKFANKIDTFSPEECETPFRLSSYSLVPSEVEGECLEWTRHYLSIHDCPQGLVSQISRAVYKNFEDSINLSNFYLQSDDKGSDNDDDDDDDDNDAGSEGSSDNDQVDNSNPQQLDASKLLQEVVSHIHATVKKWNISPPDFVLPPTSLHVCSHAIKNTRRKMEDKHVIITDLNVLFDLKDSPSQSYFAVFDGHGGLEAADYASTHLHSHLVADKQFHHDPAAAMKQAYKTTDTKFLEKAKWEGLRSGTTGVSVLIRESDMYVGWLGDSQALLVRSGQPVQIMNPHKPEREDERKRIEDLGGCVVFFGAWRVNGNISVSRAIGDAPHKPFISSDADVTSIHLTGEEEYMVLACDGLWDVLTPSQVTNIVYKHSHSSPGGLDDVAIGLVNAARDCGSSDNISVVVILFKSSLSVPQSTSDGSILLGQNELSDKNLDKFGSHPYPKPPSLNEKIKSKTKGGNQDSGSNGNQSDTHMSNWQNTALGPRDENTHHISNQDRQLSGQIQESPFSKELVRQAIFYLSKSKQPCKEDSRLVEMALRQAMSGEKNRGAQRKASDGSKPRSKAGSRHQYSVRATSHISRKGSRLSKGGNKVNKRKQRKKSRSRSLAGETQWGLGEGSSDSLSLAANRNDGMDGPSLILSNFLNNGSKSNKQLSKNGLTPLQITGTTLTATALSHASNLAVRKNVLPTMELSGTSLSLSSRSRLPGLPLSSRMPSEIDTHKNYHGKTRSLVNGKDYLSGPPKLGRGVSMLSDVSQISSRSNGSRFVNSIMSETASRYSDSMGKEGGGTRRSHHRQK